MKNKKGVELSLTTVIVALILLVVLVVVIFIFMKYTGQQGDVINQSISNVAECVPGTPEYKDGCGLLGGITGGTDSGIAQGNE